MLESSGNRDLKLHVVGMAILALTSVSWANGDNLIDNGDFSAGTAEWATAGNVTILNSGGWQDSPYARLVPASGATAELQRTVVGLEPKTRYTIAARVRTSDRLAPPILSIRSGAQIEKAHGWVAIGDENQWLERRFEVFTNPDATSLEIALVGWQTELPVTVDFDEVRLYAGRLDDVPNGDWSLPPSITAAPEPGDEIILNGNFEDGETGWSLGINAEIVDDNGPVMCLTSSEHTSRCTQTVSLGLPPFSEWTVTCQARVDPGVVASMYLESASGLSATVAIDNTEWQPITLTVQTGNEWVSGPTLKLENWKNQPGSAWYRNITWIANGEEWSPTTAIEPVPQLDPIHETFDEGLDSNRWLLSNKAWGGDNGGVTSENISIVNDFDNGKPIRALRLEAHGDLYDGDVVANGRKTRVGAAIATREYFASGRYTVRARIAPELGAVTAFWPFHYIDYYPSEPGYWHEPNPRRNTEIDWEFPTDLMGTGQDQADAFGLDPSEIAFTNARTNSWGGQFGGEGGEHKGRIVLHDAEGHIVDLAEDWAAGIYHDFTIEWHSGEIDPDSAGDERLTTGCVRWYFDDILVDELLDVEFGQGNVPFRGARFWIGVWFAAAGYGDEVGWGGSPDFNTTATYISDVIIEPFNDPRDTWVRETVPNLAWDSPDTYPGTPCPSDLNSDGWVNTQDLLLLLDQWGVYGLEDLLEMLSMWGICKR